MKRRASVSKQIFAMGGGGFSEELDVSALDQYVLSQCRRSHPKTCFIPTASGDSESYVEHFYAAFRRLDARPSHLSLFKPPTVGLEKLLLSQDIIYVGGGNTRNLLLLWKAWQLDKILWKAYHKGVLLAGVSAGAMCWFQSGLTDSYPGRYTAISLLGWLKGSFCPHFDGEPKRRPIFKKLIEQGRLPKGYGVDDGVGLHFIGGKLMKVVSSHPKAKARLIAVREGRLTESILSP